ALMAERAGIYRGMRLGDALLLAAAALALAAVPAGAERQRVKDAADPVIDGGALVFQRGDRDGWIVRRGAKGAEPLPGKHPAIGGRYIAVLRAGEVVILSRSEREEVVSFAAPNADAVAVSNAAVAYRARKQGRDRIHWRRLRP